MKQLWTGTAASLAIPTFAHAYAAQAQALTAPAHAADETYWEMVKQQFPVPAGLIMLNAANMCPSPYGVCEQVQAYASSLVKNVSFQHRAQFKEKRMQALGMLADYLGVGKEEIGITRNTTESNNIIVNGLDFKQGDEVIIWDQNHPTNNIAWEQRAGRYGFTVKKIKVPANPQSQEALLAPFAEAITSKTRLIGFSHISNESGIALPAQAICRLAREKGILTLLDGAQSFGMMDIRLPDIGCDFYTGSTHKWLMGPLENGMLYIRREHIEKIWPSVIGAGWKDSGHTVDDKICILGQTNDVTTAAIPESLTFHQTIGKANIEKRVRQLNAYLKEQIQQHIPQAKFVTPLAPELSAGITIFTIPGKAAEDIFQRLYEDHGIACASTGGIRLSPHVYNTLADMDKVVAALVSASA